MELVYFSKVEYREIFADGILKRVILLDIENRELSYQVYENVLIKAIEMQIKKSIETKGGNIFYDACFPTVKLRTGKNGIQRQLLRTNEYEYKLLVSDGIKISEEQMEKLLPYCNALDFESYRNKEKSTKEQHYFQCDDGGIYFTGVTNSYIPKLELVTDYSYDEKNIWPDERLYRYLKKEFIDKKIYMY